MDFQLGGLRVAIESVGGFSQSYEPLGGVARLRLMGGALVQQVSWRRLGTTLSGEGWWPSGIENLDYDAPLELKCAAPRSVIGQTATLVLPAARRTDSGFTPIGHAIVRGQGTVVGGGDLVPTPLSLSGDTATLTPVTGATAYQVTYWPQITVMAKPPQMEGSLSDAQHRWTLRAEEV